MKLKVSALIVLIATSFILAVPVRLIVNDHYDSTSPPPSAKFNYEVQLILDQLIAESFPELKDKQIRIAGLNKRGGFLASRFELSSLLDEHLTFILLLNPYIETHPMPPEALKAILAHELIHMVDFTLLPRSELIASFVNILANAELRQNYERSTDLETMELGYADGLKQFRLWLYDQICNNALAEDRLNHHTPEEIDAWILQNNPVVAKKNNTNH